MFRFTRDDNETARGFFQQAVRLDPFCARAHAGLSFTHFQDAFLHRTADHAAETDRAYRFAEQSVALDERDPTAHWVLGRALWLLKRQDDAVEELSLAVDLNPNFALGHYTIAFVQSQGGDTHAALRAVDLAQRLSPIDPLLFGMLGVRALACLNLGEYAQAAVWGERAAGRPTPMSTSTPSPPSATRWRTGRTKRGPMPTGSGRRPRPTGAPTSSWRSGRCGHRWPISSAATGPGIGIPP